MAMRNPPHPGVHIRFNCLVPKGLTVATGAVALGVAPPILREVVEGRASVTAELAVLLERTFGSTASHWLRLQARYDIWAARKKMT